MSSSSSSVGDLEDQVAELRGLGVDLYFSLGLHLFERKLLFERAFAAFATAIQTQATDAEVVKRITE